MRIWERVQMDGGGAEYQLIGYRAVRNGMARIALLNRRVAFVREIGWTLEETIQR